MYRLPILILLWVFSLSLAGQDRLIHVFVALCDNEHQGIVPVPASIGDGTKPHTNLYWGAGYGVKNYFDRKSDDWTLIARPESSDPQVLDRLLFKHRDQNVYLLADAYEGESIRDCIENFLLSANGRLPDTIRNNGSTYIFGGNSDLVAYTGHNGLMDFDVDPVFTRPVSDTVDVMVLGCYSKSYFKEHIRRAGANPVLWSTHLMSAEAYTLHAAIAGWVKRESGKQIAERAAQAYNKYQQCGINGARNLFTTGY